MVKNYIKIALRNIINHKLFSFINVMGLGIGIAAAIVIVLFARYELTYDQHHSKSEDIYLIYKERITPDGIQPTYGTWVPLLHQMKSDFPEVINGARIYFTSITVHALDRRFEDNTYYTDEEYFEVFDYPLEKGDNDNPFPTNNSAVISKELAKKYFGDIDPMGQEITVDFETTYTISGVLKDYPENVFIGTDLLLPIESNPQYSEVKEDWGSSFILTYILLAPEATPEGLASKFPDFIAKIWNKEVQQRTNFKLLPLHESYDTFVGDSKDSYILLYIALGIILIASINFMNLATARSMDRAREIGIRKVMGAFKNQLTGQFLSEAIFLSLLALVLGVILAELTIPEINSLFEMDLSIPYTDNPYTIPLLFGFATLLGIISGSYPAFYLSNFRIIESLKGLVSKKSGNIGLRNVLVIFQFALSIILIVGTIIIANQIRFMKNADMAFNKENLLVIPISDDDFQDREDARIKIESFRNEIARNSNVRSISTSTHVPGRWSGSNTFVRPKGWEGDPLRMRFTYHDANFFDTYGIELIAGNGFLPDKEGDQRQSVVLNEAAMEAFGWEDAENKFIMIGDTEIELVGVINDFNYESLRNEVDPILHFHRVPTNGVHRYITTRINQRNYEETLAFLEEKWKILETSMPFNYFFMDEDLRSMYQNEDRLLKMVSTFSSISIFIACLGLFGLSSFIIEKRKKEIGIRKVLGATSFAITWMLSGKFTRLILVSIVFAIPLSYYAMDRWLRDFAHHISIGPEIFILAVGASLLVAWGTVAIKSMKAANSNPVDSIRDE